MVRIKNIWMKTVRRGIIYTMVYYHDEEGCAFDELLGIVLQLEFLCISDL